MKGEGGRESQPEMIDRYEVDLLLLTTTLLPLRPEQKIPQPLTVQAKPEEKLLGSNELTVVFVFDLFVRPRCRHHHHRWQSPLLS